MSALSSFTFPADWRLPDAFRFGPAALALAEKNASVHGVFFVGLPAACPLKLFHEALRVLAPGGSFHSSYSVTEHTIAKIEKQVSSDLVMGGFVGASSVISTVRSRTSVALYLSFTATKPAYTNGGAQKLSLRRKRDASQPSAGGGAPVPAPPRAAEAGAVKLSTMDLDEDDLVDEDDLLDMAPVGATVAEPRKDGDDCETGRGACANCSCGRAEMEAGADAAAEPSACGNCYLGDGFRCAGCPSKGLPPYEPGQKPVVTAPGEKVSLGGLDADVDDF